MTRERRLDDFTNCGGSKYLKEGYEIGGNQSVGDFFIKFNAHVVQVANCMRSKGYLYLEQCDASCMYP